ncbi:MAG: hypothetical protein O7G85_10835, partial [Planctomycetota bacterium]|nr:hypothetical protein [Planctomycetota bacterium]
MASPNNETDITSPERIREVAYGVVPLMRARTSVFAFLWVLTIFGLVVVLIATAVSGMPQAPYIMYPFLGVMGIFMLASTVGPMLSDRRRSRLLFNEFAAENDTQNLEFERELMGMEAQASIWQWKSQARWTWQSLVKACATNDVTIPTTIASKTHRQSLQAIPTEPAMLEPETILTSTPQIGFMILMMVVFLFQALVALANGEWFSMVCFFTVFGLFAIQIPFIRDLIPILRPDTSAPVAGMGFIEDSKGKTWTVDDSVMILSGRTNAKK